MVMFDEEWVVDSTGFYWDKKLKWYNESTQMLLFSERYANSSLSNTLVYLLDKLQVQEKQEYVE